MASSARDIQAAGKKQEQKEDLLFPPSPVLVAPPPSPNNSEVFLNPKLPTDNYSKDKDIFDSANLDNIFKLAKENINSLNSLLKKFHSLKS